MSLRITSAKHLILGATSILIFAIVATSFATARLLRDREVETWRQQLSDLSLLLAEQTEQTMSSAQLAMDGIVERIEAMHVSNDADLRSVAQTESMHQILRDKISGLPQVDVATIVSADGNVINFTRSFPAPPINLSERDYFQARRDNASLGNFVSIPVRNKGNGKWVFYLSHRLNDSGGRFMGLVLVGISVDQFTDFFGRLATNLGEGASISLYRRDFSVLTRWPRQDETIGKQNLTGASHRVVEEMKKTADVIYTDLPRFSEGGRSTARLAAVRVLERFPMIVNLVVTEELFLANWRHTATVIGAVASGSTAALLIAAMLLLRAVRQREQSDTLLRELADQVPGLLFQLRQFPDGRVSVPYVNQRISDMYGLAPEQVRSSGSAIFSYCHSGDAERIRASIQASASTLQPWHEECRLTLPGKGNVWCQGDAQPQKLPDGSVLWHGYVADITERKRTEAQLRKLSLAVEQSPEHIVITNTAAEIEYVNEAFTRTTGYSLDEVLGQNPRILHSGRTPPATYVAMWEALAQGQPWKGELSNKRKDGSEYTEFAIIAPIRETDGRITHYVAVKEDITEKKRIGEELDKYRHHLEELVERRTTELAAARDAAQAASRAKSEFLANMSHEIRTPLNGVLGLAQIGYRDGTDRAKTRETFARIIESGKLLLGVINDILDFSKIEAGKLQIEQVEIRPGELVDHVIELMAERARDKGLLLTAEKAADLPSACLSDPLRLQQILLNLLSNAIKFTESGRVTVRASRQGECLRFEVVDTGIGMSQAQIERIFAPFEQADTSTTRRFGGTGLGLTITYRLVELLGGQITANSTAGVGSTFAITVPCHEVDLAARRTRMEQPAPAEAAERKLAGLSILVVEDNDINQMVIEEMLVSEGATVVVAGNGLEAVERVKGQGADAFDLVLMDVQMPVMDGYEATRRILEIAPGLPIVGQTAHAMEEERNKCLAVGMVDHIAKPIDPDDLVEVVLRNAAGPAPESASPHIRWDDSFSVGVKELDNHHQTLARLINTCADHASNGAVPDHLVETLTALVNYANFHFAYEEKLLAEHDYVELAEQVADHTEFSRVMAEACYEALHGQADLARLLDYLTSWWRDHILKIDMKYKGLLQARRLSSIDAS